MKCDNTRLEGVQLRDERALLEVRVLCHEDVALESNLKMISKAVLHSLVQLGAIGGDRARRHACKEERKDL